MRRLKMFVYKGTSVLFRKHLQQRESITCNIARPPAHLCNDERIPNITILSNCRDDVALGLFYKSAGDTISQSREHQEHERLRHEHDAYLCDGATGTLSYVKVPSAGLVVSLTLDKLESNLFTVGC